MDTYYHILGLEPGASQAEIKKAYFRMVRQHSPESDPEQFQKIREAYEQLKKGEDAADGPVFPPFSDPWAGKMMEQIDNYRRAGNMEKVRDACEEAWRLFPQDIRFLYLLVIAQRQCGNTGKAVRNGELLVSKEPENKWFLKELAISYLARGFTQKAYLACEKAYEAGCRDNDFLLTYAFECNEYGEFERGKQVLWEIARQDRRWLKEDIPELIEVYSGLVRFCYETQDSCLGEVMEGLCRVMEQYRIYMAEYIQELAELAAFTGRCLGQGIIEYQAVTRAFEVMREICRTEEDKNIVKEAENTFCFSRILDDPRIGETLECAYEIYYELHGVDAQTMKFALTDVQLCMVEERDEILEQAEILRQEYPDFYGKLEDFIKRLQSEKNLSYLKSSLLKTYRRLAGNFSLGFYYEKYPQEKERAQGIVISDGTSEDPYVRTGRKIGRNDPCPCGSGKKYKHCCMKKQG